MVHLNTRRTPTLLADRPLAQQARADLLPLATVATTRGRGTRGLVGAPMHDTESLLLNRRTPRGRATTQGTARHTAG